MAFPGFGVFTQQPQDVAAFWHYNIMMLLPIEGFLRPSARSCSKLRLLKTETITKAAHIEDEASEDAVPFEALTPRARGTS